MRLADFPRHPLLFGPSPVHRLERLTAHLGGADLWAKRDDCNSGLAYGGNKTRKLEYLVADALQKGCDTLVSIGGVQSNHTRQVAAVAARTGLQAELEQQERELGVFFDTIVVCSVTGSTQAGMIAGFAAQDRRRRVIGIDGSATPQETHAQVARIARRTAELLG